jgi:hypothetical protein
MSADRVTAVEVAEAAAIIILVRDGRMLIRMTKRGVA